MASLLCGPRGGVSGGGAAGTPLLVWSGLKFVALRTEVGAGSRPALLWRHMVRRGVRGGHRGIRETEATQPAMAPPRPQLVVKSSMDVLKRLEAEAEALEAAEEKRLQKHFRVGHAGRTSPTTTRTAALSAAAPPQVQLPSDPAPDEESGPKYRDVLKQLRGDISFTQVTPDNRHELLARVVTTMAHLPPEEERRLKLLKHRDVVSRLLHNTAQSGNLDQLLPQSLELLESPKRCHYRNKDEFSVQTGVDGNPKTLGFFVGAPRLGLVCVEPTHIQITKEQHKKVAALYQEYIRASPLASNLSRGLRRRPNDGGHWRDIIVRTNSDNELMVVVSLHPQDMSAEELQREKDKLIDFFRSKSDVSTLYLETSRFEKGHETQPLELLYGESHFYDSLAGARFRIGPQSFFQINTAAAELLVQYVRKCLKLNKDSLLLDLCCGVGLYSVAFAKHASHCIGVDLAEPAVDDAAINAELNGVDHKCEFHAGQLERMLPDLLNSAVMHPGDVSVVLNPNRSGVDTRVIRLIRKCPKIRRVVYVSCQPEGAAYFNLLDLCRKYKKQDKAKWGDASPFKLVNAKPINMFPLTHHCEHVFVFAR